MKCFVVVYQSLSEFYEARLFHRGGARRDEKDLFKKKKKTTTTSDRRESEKNKGEIREILRETNF
jgi:hypothetical protein